MGEFVGMTVLITGASSGIGLATARAFGREGARLILIARRESRLKQLQDVLASAHGTESRVLPLDLRDREAIVAGLEGLSDDWRAVDVLVNNAGLALGVDPLHRGKPDEWDEVIDVNVKALLTVSRTVIPWMVARNRGHVVNLGSIAGRETYPGGAVYCATKHAVRSLTRGMKMDLQGTPIRVTSIDPGLVDTEFSVVRFRGDHDRARAPYQGIQPLTGEDIAEAVLWAASRPPHVNIMDMTIFPTSQSSSVHIHRD